jgi:hypothetical protein
MGADHRQKPEWLRSAEIQGLVSAMNATKWREATEAMRHLPGGSPRFRVKDINVAQPSGWDGEWYYHLRPYESIEWLEIDADSRVEQVVSALAAVGVNARVDGELVRVYGWLRASE